MRYRLSLAALAVLLFLSAFAVSLGILGPTVTSIRARHLLRHQYGVSTPDEFTHLTGLTLKGTSSIDFTTLTSSICGFNLVSLALVSYLGGRLKRRITRPVAVALLFMFLLGFVSGVQVARAATPTYTIEPAGLLPKAYDYIIYKSGGTYYRINGTTSTATSGTDDDAIIQAALNQSKSVIIKAGSYLATVTVKGGRLVIEKGATGVTYSIQTGATCVVEDWNDGETKYYSAGTLTLRLDHASGAVYAGEYHLDGDNVTEVLEYPVQPASYIIFKSGSTIYAKNGTTGKVDYSGSDFKTVLQNVIDALPSSGGEIHFKAGTYELTPPITITKTTSFELLWSGEGESTIIKITGAKDASNQVFRVTSTSNIGSWIIRNLAFDGDATGRGTNATNESLFALAAKNVIFENVYFYDVNLAAIYILAGSENWKLDNLRFEDCGYGIWALNPSSDIKSIKISNIEWNATTRGAIAINLDNPTGAGEIREITIVNMVAKHGSGFAIALAKIKKVEVTNAYGAFFGGDSAFHIEDSSEDITFTNCIAENNTYNGFYVTNSQVKFIGCIARNNNYRGFYLTTGSDGSELIACDAINNGGVTYPGYPGIEIYQSHYVKIIGGLVQDSGADGVAITGTTPQPLRCQIISLRTKNNGDYGIDALRGDYHLIIGCVFEGDTTGAVNSVGSNNIVKWNEGYVTENSGTATLLNGTTSITVSHGLDTTPTNIQITPTSSLGLASEFWVSTVTSTSFTINVDTNPNQDVTFNWRAEVS